MARNPPRGEPYNLAQTGMTLKGFFAMNRRLLLPIMGLALAALACGINVNVPKLQTGPTETVTIGEPRPDGVADVTLTLGAGELTLSGGAEGLASGTIDYNVAEWKPAVTREGNTLAITQGSSADNIGVADNDVINQWQLKLGNTPMNLTIIAGAYTGDADLSGLPLTQLTVRDGASSATAHFDSLNPEVMTSLSYETGASNIELTGLANANFETMSFEGGAGNYSLDFSGALQRDTPVTIKSGLGNMRVVVPAASNATITVSGGVTNVNTEGTWTVSSNTYTITGSGPLLTIKIEMGLGNLTLASK